MELDQTGYTVTFPATITLVILADGTVEYAAYAADEAAITEGMRVEREDGTDWTGLPSEEATDERWETLRRVAVDCRSGEVAL